MMTATPAITTTPLVRVDRFSFYRSTSGPMLRFVEHAPPVSEHDHTLCNCTRNVADRPPGSPDQITQEVLIDGDVDGMRSTFRLLEGSLRFEWGPKPATDPGITKLLRDAGAHATFRFGRHSNGFGGRGEHSVQFGCTLPGYGPTWSDGGPLGCFSTTLYMGNRIDTSRFLNGHSPSRSSEPKSLRPTDLWLHGYVWETDFLLERVRTMPDSEEANAWRTVFLHMEEIQLRNRGYLFPEPSVEDLRTQASSDHELLSRVCVVRETAARFVQTIRATSLFRIETEIRDEMTRLAANRRAGAN
jgi:hypothetical protein